MSQPIRFSNVAYTDYPMRPLGDKPQKLAPIRKVYVLMYDGDKYAKVLLPTSDGNGLIMGFKACYLYTAPKRIDEVEKFNIEPFTVDMQTWLSLEAYEV